MSLSAKARRAPVRAVTGAYILQSGLGKLKADEETAKGLHGFASGTYGFLGKVDPKLFAKGLGAGEIALGSLVLAPFVSPVVAGLGIAGFSGALVNLYWKTPGMHQPNDPRPTPQGMAMSKDVWMAGIGVALVADGLLEPAHDKKVEVSATRQGKKLGKQSRKDRKAAKKSRAEAREHALEATKGASYELGRRAQKAANKAAEKASKQAKKASSSDAAANARKVALDARASVLQAVDEYRPVVADKAKQAAGVARDYADEYGPVVAGKAKQAADVARGAVDDYAPVVAEKAKQVADVARGAVDDYGPVVAEKAKQVADAARGAVDEYGPVVAKNAKQARDAAQAAAEQARVAGLRARDRVAG